MKPLPFFLACLLLVAAFDLALDIRQRASLRTISPLLAQIMPAAHADDAFTARLAASVDPTELREMARTQHAKRVDAYHLTAAMLGSCNQMNGAAILRGATLFMLSLCALIAACRPWRAIRNG